MIAAGVLLSFESMGTTFTHKLLMMILAGFVAACMLWGFRHIIQQALYETSDAGWKKSLTH